MSTLLCTIGALILIILFFPRSFAVCITIISMLIFGPLIGIGIGVIVLIAATIWSKKNMP